MKKFNEFVNENENIESFTEQFKNWFDDSKIVDNNGDPLPVYHGSPLGGIEKFKNKDYNDKTIISSGLKEFGIFFTTNISLALKYKNERKLSPDYIKDIKNDIFKLENILDKVRNNREYDKINNEIEKLEHKIKGGVYQTYLKIVNPYIFDAKGKDGSTGWYELKVDIGYKIATGIDAIEALSGNNDMYKSKYDGIIAKNIIDLHLHIGNTNLLSQYNNYMSDIYMVFSPSQTMIEKEF